MDAATLDVLPDIQLLEGEAVQLATTLFPAHQWDYAVELIVRGAPLTGFWMVGSSFDGDIAATVHNRQGTLLKVVERV